MCAGKLLVAFDSFGRGQKIDRLFQGRVAPLEPGPSARFDLNIGNDAAALKNGSIRRPEVSNGVQQSCTGWKKLHQRRQNRARRRGPDDGRAMVGLESTRENLRRASRHFIHQDHHRPQVGVRAAPRVRVLAFAVAGRR